MYADPAVKPWTSSKWTPPGYITRKQRDETRGVSSGMEDDATRIGSTDSSREKKSLGGVGSGRASEARVEDAGRVV